ncbi:unnamed protein product [Prunus brigantina]
MATFIYAYLKKEKQKYLWNLILNLKPPPRMPWALLGDFNNICSPSEKLGGSISTHPDWLTMFPNYVLSNLPICRSDHGPIVLTSSTPRTDTQKVFRMEAMWLSHTDFPHVIFGNLFQKLKETQEHLNLIQSQLANSPTSSFLINKNSELTLHLRSILENEEIFYAQRARVNWLQHGDKNTKFFQTFATIRKKRNHISRIKDNSGAWIDTPFLGTVFVEAYRKRFTQSDPIAPANVQEFISIIEPCISIEDNSFLMAGVSELEVLEAVNSIGALKAPGLDGLHAIFFHQCWVETKHLLVQMVNDFFLNNLPLNPINHTNIALIPENNNPETVDHFRPISLCNVAYKVITKIIISRLKPILAKCISPNQGAFARGRSIFDNILIAHELFCDFKRKKSSCGAMALKLDLEKAYDLLDWNYIRACLLRFGFTFGQCINFHKSTIYFSPRILSSVKNNISTILQIQHRIRSKFAGWKANTLSRAGKLTLIKSNVSGMPNHVLSCFKCPPQVIKEMNRCCRSFFWGKEGTPPVAWKDVCMPKDQGGLGVKMAKFFNLAALAKLGWICITDQSNWWVKVVTQKYLIHEIFFNLKKKSNHSVAWKSILDARQVLCKGLRWVVGNGGSIPFWTSHWVLPFPLLDLIPEHQRGYLNLDQKVADFITNNSWDRIKLAHPIPVSCIHAAATVGLDYWKLNSSPKKD